MQVRMQQLEPDMQQQTSSKIGKEYIKAAYCQPVFLLWSCFQLPMIPFSC